MSEHLDQTAVTPEEPLTSEEDGPPPSELESLLLSVALFGGLILFSVGCTVLNWFG